MENLALVVTNFCNKPIAVILLAYQHSTDYHMATFIHYKKCVILKLANYWIACMLCTLENK